MLETEVTPGNVHDSVAFDTVFERLVEHYPEVQVIAADAGYKTPWICKQIFDSGRILSLPYKRPMTKKGNLPWYEYVYDEYYDCVLCPQNQILSYATTNRDGNREYKSKSYICKSCPVREHCTENQQCTKTVTRHVWHDYIERAEDVRHSDIGKKTYALRSQTIERVFADAKEKHAMRYTPYRGLPAVTAWAKLKFAAMNLKKLAIHKWMRLLFSAFLSYKKPHCRFAMWLLLTSWRRVSVETRRASLSKKPRRAREGRSPLELPIVPGGVYGGKVACPSGKEVALRPAKRNRRFRFAASGAIFAAENSIFQRKNRCLAVFAPVNLKDFSKNW